MDSNDQNRETRKKPAHPQPSDSQQRCQNRYWREHNLFSNCAGKTGHPHAVDLTPTSHPVQKSSQDDQRPKCKRQNSKTTGVNIWGSLQDTGRL